MNHTENAPRAPLAGILGIIGGALMAVGSFLAWAEVPGGGTSVIAKGVDGSDGPVTTLGAPDMTPAPMPPPASPTDPGV